MARVYTVLAAVVFLLATNKWMGFEQGMNYLSSWDVLDYKSIAEAAPALPAKSLSEKPMPFHKAQRLAIPYVVGTVAKLTGAPLSTVFIVLSAICLALTLGAFLAILGTLRLSNGEYAFCAALFLLNPYPIRYYLLASGMTTDVAFAAGLAVALLGLLQARGPVLFLGILLAALGRQTVLLALPGVFCWILFAPAWKRKSLAHGLGLASLLTATVLGVYLGGGAIASTFASESKNLSTMTGVFTWALSDSFNAKLMIEHLGRVALPYLVISVALATVAFRCRLSVPIEFWACLLIVGGMCSQPVLAGPEVTLGNGARLSTLALIPMVVAFALALKSAIPRLPLGRGLLHWAPVGAVLAIASLHHMYSAAGPGSVAGFVALQATAAAYISIAILRARI